MLTAVRAGTTIIDFDHVVEGNWKRLVVLCSGVSTEEAETALGFQWETLRETQKSDFFGMLIFVDGSSVEQYANMDGEEMYFVPCEGPGPHDEVDSEPLLLDRKMSQIEFEFSRANGYWFRPID
jgi:hypothetical protein